MANRSWRWWQPVRRRVATAAGNTTSIINGKVIAAEIRATVKADSEALVARGAQAPGLAVVLVGSRPDSVTYVSMKKAAAAEVGFHSVTKEFPADVGQAELLRTIQQLNDDPAIDGIIVQVLWCTGSLIWPDSHSYAFLVVAATARAHRAIGGPRVSCL